MKELVIKNRKFEEFIINLDDEDHEWISKYKWYISKESKTFYAKCDLKKDKKRIRKRMHIEILKKHGILKNGDYVDHIDHNGLNNQKSNLRACLKKENNRNVSVRNNEYKSSIYKGVVWIKHRHKWISQITCDGIRYSLGYYDDEKYAAAVYNFAAKELFKEFAELNSVDVELIKPVILKKKKANTSNYKGVSWHKSHGKWYAEITINYSKVKLGAYSLEIDAAKAYNNYIINNNINRKMNIIYE